MAQGMFLSKKIGFRPMTMSPADSPANHGGLVKLQAHRLQQIVWATVAAIGVALVTSALHASYLRMALLALALAAMGCVYLINRRGQLELATRVMLGTMLVLLSSLVFVGRGLFDGAVYAFPALLVFASMFGSRQLFVSLVAIMLAVLASVYALEVNQVLVHIVPTNLGVHVANVAAILSVTAFLIWLLASDLRDALGRVESDKKNILESHARIEMLAARPFLVAKQVPDGCSGFRRQLATQIRAKILGGDFGGSDVFPPVCDHAISRARRDFDVESCLA